ncbi:hypothetical protein l13_05020 [Neisseria weaveri ATCC 51223]|nr:hypothetical protein l13_05020 [Neisseria weaveri ATCC 51223]
MKSFFIAMCKKNIYKVLRIALFISFVFSDGLRPATGRLKTSMF